MAKRIGIVAVSAEGAALCHQSAHLITSLRGVYSQHRKRRHIGEAAAKEHLAPLPGAGFRAPRGSPVGRREQ